MPVKSKVEVNEYNYINEEDLDLVNVLGLHPVCKENIINSL